MQNVNTKDLLQAAFTGGIQMLCTFSSISPTGEVRRDLGEPQSISHSRMMAQGPSRK